MTNKQKVLTKNHIYKNTSNQKKQPTTKKTSHKHINKTTTKTQNTTTKKQPARQKHKNKNCKN